MERAIRKLPDDIKVAVTWKPFYLDPSLPTKSVNKMEMYRRKFGNRIDGMLPHMIQTGKAEGINFSYGGNVGNTERSHRLLEKALRKGGEKMQDAVVEKVFSLYFEQEGDVADTGNLSQIGVDCGVFGSINEARAFFEGTELKREVADEVEISYRRGVSGVPFFIINGSKGQSAFSGAQEPDTFTAAFNKLA